MLRLTMGGPTGIGGTALDAGFVNIDLAYLFNDESFHNETVMLSFGFDF